jgi:hypothetical protein
LDARPHELTLLKIKHIRLKDKYGEGEIPHEAKTGTGPILFTLLIHTWVKIRHNAYTKKMVIYQFDRYIKRGREREF